MKGKIRLTTLLLATMLCLQINSYAQSEKVSKVTIEMTYKDKDGKKHSETKELVGAEADNFDMDAYEKSLADRGIKVLNLNINQTSSKMGSGDKELHEEMKVEVKDGKVFINGAVVQDLYKDIDLPKSDEYSDHVIMNDDNKQIEIIKSGNLDGDKKMKKNIVIMKTISADSEDDELKDLMDSDDFEIEEKDGKIYINGKEMKGAQKRVRVMKSGEGEMNENMEVEVKDGKVFINREEVDDADVEKGEHKVIIKKIDGGKSASKQIKVMKSGDEGVDEDMKVEVRDGKIFLNGEEVGDAEMDKGNQRIVIKKIEGGQGDSQNVWISKDNEKIDLEKHEGHMLFISNDEAEKPRLGIAIEDGQTVNGAAVVGTVPDSPAAKAGLQKGDVVTALNDTKVYGANSLMTAMDDFKAGDEVKVTYDRGGKVMTTTVKLEIMEGAMHQFIEKEIIIEKKEDKQ